MARADSRDKRGRFYILGIIHRDEENGRIIGNWLNSIMPRVVTLEFSRYGLMFRKEKGSAYRNRVDSVLARMKRNGETVNEKALSFLNAYIDVPSEYKIASHYCSETRASMYLVDMGLFSYRKLKHADELFSEANIRNLLGGCADHVINNERVIARLFFNSGVRSIAPYGDEMRTRDKYMSQRIGRLLRKHQGECAAHITGWRHLQDPCDFFTPLHPVKVFPYD